MSLILSIETATDVCSVALHQQGTLLGGTDLCLEKSHSKMLTAMIDQLMANTGNELSELQAVAVSKGPGSYTGLRIGVATAKGLCFGLKIPLIAVNTLKALTMQLLPLFGNKYWYCPMLDARRMEVYCLVADHQLGSILKTAPRIIDEGSFREQLDRKPLLFFGNGSGKCRDVIKHPNAHFIDGIATSAESLGALALEKYGQRDFEDLAYFEPFYLKEFRSTQRKKKAGIIK